MIDNDVLAARTVHRRTDIEARYRETKVALAALRQIDLHPSTRGSTREYARAINLVSREMQHYQRMLESPDTLWATD